MLSYTEERLLLNKYLSHGDIVARNTLVNDYMGYIVSRAKGITKNYELQQDLINEGVIGMIQAIDRFDVSTTYRLLTFAGAYIYGGMQNYIKSSLPHMSYKKTDAKIIQLTNHLRKEYTDDFKHSDIVNFCSKYSVKYSDVMSVINCLYLKDSYNYSHVANDNDVLQEVIEKELDESLDTFLSALEIYEKDLLIAGIFGDRGDIALAAAEHRIGRSWSSQIHLKYKKQLQKHLKDYA